MPATSNVGNLERIAKFERGVAENFKRKLQARSHFALILGRLGAQAKHFGFESQQPAY